MAKSHSERNLLSHTIIMISGLISLYVASLIKTMPYVKTEVPTPVPFHQVLSAAPLPEEKKEVAAKSSPGIQASSYIAMDLRSGKILTSKNIKSRRSIASITKLMTALIILDEHDLNDIVKVSANGINIEGSRIWLAQGEKITIRDLLYGLLIHSGNDAAYTLAIHNAGTIEKFITKMNEKAGKLGLTATHFGNPAGLDRADNYSTAEDIALLGSYAYRNSFIRHAVSIPKITVMSVNGQFKHELKSTNTLLEKDSRFRGLKTGHTAEAGYSFVGVATLPNNAPILTVVLDSPDRFKESIALLDWTRENFTW